MVAISPQSAAQNAEVKAKHNLAFAVLSDHDNTYAKQLGLAHELPADLQGVYQGFGVDLPALHGVQTWELPMPTRLVIATDGTVRDVAADPDYTQRPEPDATLEVLQAL